MSVVTTVAGIVSLIMVTSLVRSGSRRLGVPDPIALLLIGAAAPWVPYLPPVHVDPEPDPVVELPLLLRGARPPPRCPPPGATSGRSCCSRSC